MGIVYVGTANAPQGPKHLSFGRVSQLHFSSTHAMQVYSAVYRIETTSASIGIVDCFFHRSVPSLWQRCRCATGFISINRRNKGPPEGDISCILPGTVSGRTGSERTVCASAWNSS